MTAPELKITIKNNLRLTGIPERLHDILVTRLKFKNPKYEENRRMNRWNRGVPRELKFYSRVRGGLWIPRGFTRQLIDLCRNLQIPYAIEDQRRSLPEVNFVFRGKLRAFQRKAVERMLVKDFGTLDAPTGSGKTIMALYILARRRQPAVIIVHTKDLAAQWLEQIEHFLGIPPDDIGLIGSGKKTIGAEITVALVQSLYKCADEIARHIGHLVVDECHRTPSRTFTEAVTEFDCRYMLGLSATPWRRDKLSNLIFWHLGDVHHQVDQAHLVRSGDVLRAEVVFRETDFKPYFDPVTEYSKMLSELTANDDRNRLIVRDVAAAARNHSGICLVLSDRKRHCESLRAMLKYKHGIESEILTGDVQPRQREGVRTRLLQGEIRILIATGQLIGEGFDCPDLATLFLATPVRFSGRIIQYLGRILRPAPGKDRARVYDYVDVNVKPLVKAAQNRRRVYGIESSRHPG
jgi:superfamily II DNA or RNA helicase